MSNEVGRQQVWGRKGALSSYRRELSSFLSRLLKAECVFSLMSIARSRVQVAIVASMSRVRVREDRGGNGAVSSCWCPEASSTFRLKRQSGACVFSQLEVARSGKKFGRLLWFRMLVKSLGLSVLVQWFVLLALRK
jgi:hypothetical protein